MAKAILYGFGRVCVNGIHMAGAAKALYETEVTAKSRSGQVVSESCTTNTVQIGSVKIGPDAPLLIIGGPCAIESRELCLQIGGALREKCAELGQGYIFKASFDKANRSSIDSGRGLGVDEGLRIMDDVRRELDVPVTSDIHEASQATVAAQVVDLLQIPAFLCRQTDLLTAAAGTGKPVNVKKGQFLSPGEMTGAIRKIHQGANAAGVVCGGIVLTERGTFFGYHRLVNDFAGLADMMELGWPVCFDVTHSTQRPGEGPTTGGQPHHAPLLGQCAVAAGVSALFIETHPEPANAISDAATMLPLDTTIGLLDRLARIRQACTD